MTNDLTGKKAFITGGSRGIGKAIVQHFASEGAKVAFTYNSSKEQADSIAQEIINDGGEASAIQFDASNPENAQNALDKALEYLNEIDILVNNAGIGKEGKIGSEGASLENFDKVFNVNVRSVYALTHLTVPHLKSGARIINVSSILGERAVFPDIGIYNASKFAVSGLTRSWAHDLGEKNITVNAIMPGPIDTDMNPASQGNEQAQKTALKKYGEPEDIANMAVFLASDKSSYITGSTFNVDGGINA